MREIKFRVWDIDKRCWQYFGVEGMKEYWYVDNSSFGQLTGLKDKNGLDIYEGDILDVSWLAELGVTEIDCMAIGVVKWDEANPCFYVEVDYKINVKEDFAYEETALPLYKEDERYEYVIIGNIYENKELIQ